MGNDCAAERGSKKEAEVATALRFDKSESFAARDSKLARSLGEEEDAELARRVAMQEAMSRWSWPPFESMAGSDAKGAPGQHRAATRKADAVPGGSLPPKLTDDASKRRAAAACAGQPRCGKGHELKASFPLNTVHSCDSCGRPKIQAPEQVWRCDLCNYDLCSSCAQMRFGSKATAGSAAASGGNAAPRTSTARGGEAAANLNAQQEGMIYVACEIGEVAVEMMVDTGAQMSVISAPLVRQFALSGYLDTSAQGIAAGVGHARILGKLRGVPVKTGHVEFALDFSVLDISDNLLMLGLDQMRRFKCIVDLDRKCLVFGGSGGLDVPFLQQAQEPSKSKLLVEGCPQM